MTGTTGPFKLLHDLSSSNDFIRGDNFLALSKKVENIVYSKRDFVLKSGFWRGEFQPSLVSRRKDLGGKVLTLGHSDSRTSKLYSGLLIKTLGLKAVFGSNTDPSCENVQSVPLGITNNTRETQFHPLFGDESHFFAADSESEFPSEFYPRLYANFTAQNNASVRKPLIDSLKTLPSTFEVSHDQPEFTEKGRVRFLSMCRTTNFVLCPEGNGIDTHRLWETLYMGGVPIVKRHPYMNSFFEILPVVQVAKWTDLGLPGFLEREWTRVKTLRWNKSAMLQSYWNGVITASAESS